MFDVRFKGRLCVPSLDALKDMDRHDVPPSMVETIITDGEDYTDARTPKGETGRAVQSKGFLIFVKLVPSYSYSLDEEIFLIKHVGKRRLVK
jgi:hypothetical protein